MLSVGDRNTSTCAGPHRRAFLQVGASSVLGLSLADLLRARAAGATGGAKAKAVILLWLWGGPSQLDTFDPKPNASLDYRGPFGTIPTRIPGVRFGELFPQLAGHTDKLAVVRTLTSQSNDHGIAGTIGLTGSAAGGTGLDGKPLQGSARPALGSVVAKALASGGLKQDIHPFFVVGGKLHQGKKAIIGEGGGPLGAACDPVPTGVRPRDRHQSPGVAASEGTHAGAHGRPAATARRARERRQARQRTRFVRRARRVPRRALAMLTSRTAADGFDLSKERNATRDAYGRTRFGQSCLLAPAAGRSRRAVRAGELERPRRSGGGQRRRRLGSPLPQLPDHAGPARAVARPVDRARCSPTCTTGGCSTRRWCIAVGEFGRSPKINDKAGREHHPDCYSALARGRRGEGRAVRRHQRRASRKTRRHAAVAGRSERDRAEPDRADE